DRHGSISAMPTTRPPAAHAIDNGTRVRYIQKEPRSARGKTKIMPVPAGTRSRSIRPSSRCSSVAATSTRRGSAAPILTTTVVTPLPLSEPVVTEGSPGFAASFGLPQPAHATSAAATIAIPSRSIRPGCRRPGRPPHDQRKTESEIARTAGRFRRSTSHDRSDGGGRYLARSLTLKEGRTRGGERWEQVLSQHGVERDRDEEKGKVA